MSGTYEYIMGKNNLQRAAGQVVQNLRGGNDELRSNGVSAPGTGQMRPGSGDPAIARVENPTAGYKPAVQLEPSQVKPVVGYGDMLSRLGELDRSRQADIEALKKKESRDAKLAAVADGLDALHNIYARSRGIEPVTGGGPSASSRSRERYARLRMDLDKDYSDKLQTHLRMEKLRQDSERHAQLDQYRRDQLASQERDRVERRKMQQELYKARIGKLIDESTYTWAYQNALASGMNEAEAISAALAASKLSADELAAQGQAESDSKVRANDALANQRNAAAGNSRAKAANVGAPKTSTRYDKDGNVTGKTVTTTGVQRGGGSGKPSGGNGKKTIKGVNWKTKK